MEDLLLDLFGRSKQLVSPELRAGLPFGSCSLLYMMSSKVAIETPRDQSIHTTGTDQNLILPIEG
jgi:hypothetical protein